MGRARRLPGWLRIAPLVLGAHALLFWAAADRKFLPRPFASGTPAAPPPTAAAPPNFSARQEPLRDPQTGEELGAQREWTVSTRLAAPPARPPAPTPARANAER